MREALEMALLAFVVVDLGLLGAFLAVTVARVAGSGREPPAAREERAADAQRMAEHSRVGRITV